MWMARISGQAKERFMNESLMDASYNWTDETTFSNQTSGAWYDSGKNATIYKLMSWGKQTWCNTQGSGYILPDEAGVEPTYFKKAYFAGEERSFQNSYQVSSETWIIPLVCLYEINWDAYYNATSPAT
jgi:hypothetical protein